jgi:sterol desaturase/sphingolipid hydroxylase (fatty acid hydroxylase superfamily)
VREERDSNWSSGISIWDRLHGTFRDRPAQRDLAIGVASSGDSDIASLAVSLVAPFTGRNGQ